MKDWLIIFRNNIELILSPAFGSLLVLGFAPFNINLFLALSICYLYLTLPKYSIRQSFLIGLLFGIGMFGCGTWWIFISVHEFGNTSLPLALLITILFVLLLSLFIAFQCLFTRMIESSAMRAALVFACSWVMFEFIRGWILTGFPWLFIGHSQCERLFGGYLPIVGVFGTSFIFVYFVCLIANVISNYQNLAKERLSIYIILGLLIVGYGLNGVNWTHQHSAPIKVSIIQANIAQDIKWNNDTVLPTLKKYMQLTKMHLTSDLIIWPEAAIPIEMNNAKPFLDELTTILNKSNTGLITGISLWQKNNMYNAAIGLGQAHGTYLKHFLVPFGEFIPFKFIFEDFMTKLQIPMGDFARGSNYQSNLTFNNILVAPYICYEIVYSEALVSLRKNANIMLTISNDAWFGESIALDQHLQIAQASSKQSGKPQLVSTSTGLTAFINQFGEIQKIAKPFIQTVLTSDIFPVTGLTPFLYIGYLPIMFLIFLMYLILSITSRRASTKK